MSEHIFERVNPERRQFLQKLLMGAAFVAPVVATFSVESLTSDPVYAASYACAPPVVGLQPANPVVPPPPSAYAPVVPSIQAPPVDAVCPNPTGPV